MRTLRAEPGRWTAHTHGFIVVTGNLASMAAHPVDPDQVTKANLIFYCDNDEKNAVRYSAARWQVRPDDPNIDPNSRRDDGVDQEWFDQDNFITRDPTTNGCQDLETDARGPTYMETFRQDIEPFVYGRRLVPLGLQEERSTISVSHAESSTAWTI